MKKKIPYYACSIVIVASNIAMATVLNDGEGIISNVFLIVIAIITLPVFTYAVNIEKTSLVRFETVGLLVLTALSVVRLINRICTLPDIVMITMIIITLIACIFFAVVSYVRISKRIKNHKR